MSLCVSDKDIRICSFQFDGSWDAMRQPLGRKRESSRTGGGIQAFPWLRERRFSLNAASMRARR
jgi:hypothetical protein